MRLIDGDALKMYAGLAVNDDGTAYALGHIIDAAQTVSCDLCEYNETISREARSKCLFCRCGSHFTPRTEGGGNGG